jgi:hypothetical protein
MLMGVTMNKLKRVLTGCAVVVVTGLLGAGGADAAFIRGNVDPVFTGSGNANGLYWTGLIQFDADLSCLNQNGINVLQPPPNSCDPFGGFANLQVSATLGTSQGSLDTITINFTAGSPNIGLFLSGGTPIGISAPTAPPGQFGATPFFFSPTVRGNAWLQFDFDAGPFTGLSHGIFFLEICGGDGLPVCTGIGNATSGVGALVVTVVPEPPVAWLLLAAMPVAWLVRRRRSQAR